MFYPDRCLIFRMFFPFWMFCPSGCFVLPDVLSFRTFCPSGRFVLPDDFSPAVLSHGCSISVRYVSGCFFSGRFVPPNILYPDVLSGHCTTYCGCPRTVTYRNSICLGCFSVVSRNKKFFFRFVLVFRTGIETTETNRTFFKQTETKRKNL
jgi:hypothetical protein